MSSFVSHFSITFVGRLSKHVGAAAGIAVASVCVGHEVSEDTMEVGHRHIKCRRRKLDCTGIF